MNDDMTLLKEFATRDSEKAFSTLVERHIGMVHSAAMRQVSNSHLAEEITQAVFIILARKAGSLSKNIILSGWLFRTTRFAAMDVLKTETRRQRREQEAAFMTTDSGHVENEAAWQEISPLLDEAIAQLGEKDRDAVVLRFFEKKNFHEVGSSIGANEEAAKKRVNRAVEKLRVFFSKRGVVPSVATFTGVLGANSVSAAPLGLAATVSASAVLKGTLVSASTLTVVNGALKIMAWTKIKTTIVATIVVASTVTPLAIQHQSRVKTVEENQSLRQQIAQLQLDKENISARAAETESAQQLSSDEFSELLQLRGRVAMLERNQAGVKKQQREMSFLDHLPATEDLDSKAGEELGMAIVQGDLSALNKLVTMSKAEHQSYKTNNSPKLNDTQRGELSRVFAGTAAAFRIINEAIAKGNPDAIKAVELATQNPELQGRAIGSLGILAGQGNEAALEILLNPHKYQIIESLDSTLVSALKPAADNGSQKAIDALAAFTTNKKRRGLWYMVAQGLENAAESGNSVAIEGLINMSAETNSSIRKVVISGLKRASNQNARAAETLRQMNIQ